jgi:hypothetical protein
MSAFRKLRDWFKAAPADPEAVAEAKRLEQDKITVRLSQTGRQPYAGIPPTPDILDPDLERR